MLDVIRQRSEQAARTCAILLGLSIPISVAVDNALLGLLLLFWLASLTRQHFALLRHPVAAAALILFGVLLAGLAYGDRNAGDGWRYLGKYADLVFVPVFISLFQAQRHRIIACYAFAAAMIVTLVVSYLLATGVIGQSMLADADPHSGEAFKRYLTQNVMMAFAALLFAYLGLDAETSLRRAMWLAAAVLAAANVILINPGRTGQLILLALAIYLAYSAWRWKGAICAASAVMIATLAVGMDSRMIHTINEWQAWQPGTKSVTATGQRLDFYRHGYEITLEHPLVGYGTGSFPKAYASHLSDSVATPTDNPHNEYLLMAVQTGVVGLLAMLYLFFCELRYANRLPQFERHMARALVIMMTVGCLFNSLLLDHTEGLFFAWMSGVLFGALTCTSRREAAA